MYPCSGISRLVFLSESSNTFHGIIIALDYEGVYRKTGGSTQSKAITQLFERGDYDAFDLCDADRFTDISSITSVLKTYFRSLPIPLLTFDLHDQFIQAVGIRDAAARQETLIDLINSLPNEHYYTLRMLVMHLHQCVRFLSMLYGLLTSSLVWANELTSI